MTKKKEKDKDVEKNPELHGLLSELREKGITEQNKALRYAYFHRPDVYKRYIATLAQFSTPNAEVPIYPTGISCLDRVVGGGLRLGTSYEFFGEYGSGKTQLVLTIAKVMAEKGFRVVYLYTEGKPPVIRIKHVVGNSNNFAFAQVYGPDHFKILLRSETAINSDVVIIDSITGIFRRIFKGTENIAEYKSQERELLRDLFAYIDTDGIVIMTNQVYSGVMPGIVKVPFGGHILYHFSNYRIKITRKDERENSVIAELYAEDCPDVPPISCRIKITNDGVTDA